MRSEPSAIARSAAQAVASLAEAMGAIGRRVEDIAAQPMPPLTARRKMRDLSLGVGPGIFRIRDQQVDRQRST